MKRNHSKRTRGAAPLPESDGVKKAPAAETEGSAQRLASSIEDVRDSNVDTELTTADAGRNNSAFANKKSKLNPALFSSASDSWATPPYIFAWLDAEFHFTLDPCSSETNFKCARHFTLAENGLLQPWVNETVFMNPPYSEVEKWMRKAYQATHFGCTVVCLVPARTDTKWWHEFAMQGEVRLIRGRIRFEGGRYSAPFPSAIVVLRPRGYALRTVEIPKEEQLRLPFHGT